MHSPTDINLLWDAMRKLIEICVGLCADFGLSDWRQCAHQRRRIKKLFRQVQRLKHSSSKDEEKRAAKQEAIRQAHRDSLEAAETLAARVRETLGILQFGQVPATLLAPLQLYLDDAERQIDQIRRRALLGETIPHAEKVFSLFERHTDWIGAARDPLPAGHGATAQPDLSAEETSGHRHATV